MQHLSQAKYLQVSSYHQTCSIHHRLTQSVNFMISSQCHCLPVKKLSLRKGVPSKSPHRPRLQASGSQFRVIHLTGDWQKAEANAEIKQLWLSLAQLGQWLATSKCNPPHQQRCVRGTPHKKETETEPQRMAKPDPTRCLVPRMWLYLRKLEPELTNDTSRTRRDTWTKTKKQRKKQQNTGHSYGLTPFFFLSGPEALCLWGNFSVQPSAISMLGTQ